MPKPNVKSALKFSPVAQSYIAYNWFIEEAGDCNDSQLVQLTNLQEQIPMDEWLKVRQFLLRRLTKPPRQSFALLYGTDPERINAVFIKESNKKEGE